MRRFIYFLALIFVISSCSDDKDIVETALPAAAREFINKHFPGVGFSHGEQEHGGEATVFEVVLKNGVEIEFSKSGDWISVDCKFTTMPEGILALIPEKIIIYLTEIHTGSKIIKIEKEIYGYEISINNSIPDLIFNHDGTFVGFDV